MRGSVAILCSVKRANIPRGSVRVFLIIRKMLAKGAPIVSHPGECLASAVSVGKSHNIPVQDIILARRRLAVPLNIQHLCQ